MLNNRATSDARHSRTGKDALIYDGDGNAFAQVDSFQASASFDNVKYQPLGQNRDLEASNTVGVSITISEIVVLDGTLFNAVMAAVASGESPVLTFQGAIEGRNGSQERVTYNECVFSGDTDIQNVSTGDVLKRNYSLFCNGDIVPTKALTI